MGLWDFEEEHEGAYTDEEYGETDYELTVDSNGNYTVYTRVPVNFKIYFGETATYTEIEGETAAELNNPQIGEKYFCEVTYGDGTVEISDAFEFMISHTCDFSGEWRYDAAKHWKECTFDGCKKTSEEATHSFTDGACSCGYVCPHESYTDGVCDICGYECAHEWSEGVLTRPNPYSEDLTEGYYTYTCEICGDTYTETVESADISDCQDLLMRAFDYSVDNTLTEEVREEIYQSYLNFRVNNKEIINEAYDIRGDLIASEQGLVDAATAELQEILADIEAKIASGEYVKVDGAKIIVEYDIELNSNLKEKYGEDNFKNVMSSRSDEVMAEGAEIATEAMALTGTVAENAEKIEELKARLKALYDAVELCLNGTHSYKYEVTSPASCGVNAKETGTCAVCGETNEREAEGTALAHSFTKYEVVTAAECGKAGLERAVCDNNCGETDEKEIVALEHNFIDYVSNGDATCTADGTKTAECANGCGATDTVTDEGTKLDHPDEDGDKICDDCQTEIVDVCPDCGRPVHADTGVPQYICLIITFIKLVVSFVKALA